MQADQRRGRTGRTCDGHVYRLVKRSFYTQLEDYEPPAILRLSLRQQVLLLCCAESKAINDPKGIQLLCFFSWIFSITVSSLFVFFLLFLLHDYFHEIACCYILSWIVKIFCNLMKKMKKACLGMEEMYNWLVYFSSCFLHTSLVVLLLICFIGMSLMTIIMENVLFCWLLYASWFYHFVEDEVLTFNFLRVVMK